MIVLLAQLLVVIWGIFFFFSVFNVRHFWKERQNLGYLGQIWKIRFFGKGVIQLIIWEKFCDLNSEKERLEDTIKNGLYHRTASLYIDLNYGTYKIFYIKYLLLDIRKADKRKSGSWLVWKSAAVPWNPICTNRWCRWKGLWLDTS